MKLVQPIVKSRFALRNRFFILSALLFLLGCGGEENSHPHTQWDSGEQEWTARTTVERFVPLRGAFETAVLWDLDPGDEFKRDDRFYQITPDGKVVFRADITPTHLLTLHQPYNATKFRLPTSSDVVWLIQSDSGGDQEGHQLLGHLDAPATLVFQSVGYQLLRAENGETTLRATGLVLQPVKETFVTPQSAIWEVTLAPTSGEEFTLSGTANHPFYVPALDAYVPLENLQPGWEVGAGDHSRVRVVSVRDANRAAETYNFEVDHDHNYVVVSPAADPFAPDSGVLVHNTCWKAKVMKHLGIKAVPQWMKKFNPHGHHIIPKGLSSGKNGAIAEKLRALARKTLGEGWDHVNDLDNLALAPNGLGIHSKEGLEKVLKELQGVAGKGEEAFRGKLKDIGERMLSGDFFVEMGQKID